jgi:membrane associated rhomboid family serine protease
MMESKFSASRHYFRPRFTGAVRVLILINVAVFFLQFFIPQIITFLGLVPVLVLKKYYIWQLVTYMFLHGGFLHLIFNMFILWMFGSELEARWGRNMFLRYYFITGIGAGMVYVLARYNSFIPTIGASGAIFGLLLAFGLTFPNRYVYLYFFIPVKAKFLVLIFGAIEFFAAFTGAQDNIAHFAHLGGLLVGFLYLKVFGGWGKFWRRIIFTDRKSGDADVEIDDTDFEDRVNQVLRKLSRVGLDGLTSYEKEILEEARKRYRKP